MNTKNPIRKYFAWYGNNLTEIANEPAKEALCHYGKFVGKNMVIGVAVGAVTYGLAYLGSKVYQKATEYKED